MKICKVCNTEKPLSEYHKSSGNKSDGRRPVCAKCVCEKRRAEYVANPGPIKESVKKWQAAHREQERARNKKYRERHREERNASAKKWRDEHPERVRELCRKAGKKWEAAHPEKVREKNRNRFKRIRSTAKGKLSHNISVAIRQALHSKKAGRSWESLVNFTVDELKRHLERRFKPGMSWENYGAAWVIDHKIPISVFNYENPEDIDFLVCWSLKNLQPLETKQNNKKHTHIDRPFQPALLIGGSL